MQVKKDHFVTDYMGYTPYKFQIDKWVRVLLSCAQRPSLGARALPTALRRQGGPQRSRCLAPPGILLCQPPGILLLLCAAAVLWSCVGRSAAANAALLREQGKDYLGGEETMSGLNGKYDFPCNVSEDGVVHCPA